MKERVYAAIELKSFYASVECAARGLDALVTNLVVADKTRTEKTICLAVSPSLKALGISGRARLFEVVSQVEAANAQRRRRAPGGRFAGKSCDARELAANPSLAIDYIVAPPRMAAYIERSAEIFRIYLAHVSAEDVHVYSIDEVFIDLSGYLRLAGKTAHDFTMTLVKEVLAQTGITATAGIGINLYLAKVAMDIVAKHAEPDADGVRIAELDEASYRRLLWTHEPITDFWRVGRGYAAKLERIGIRTMGDVARASLGAAGDWPNEGLLYKLFGVNAELLIDHAWGWEPITLPEIKAYRPQSQSVGVGQVLQRAYDFGKARIVVREMADQLAFDLVKKGLLCDQLVLTVGYEKMDASTGSSYEGSMARDYYGRVVPKHAHGTANLPEPTSSSRVMVEAAMALFDEKADPRLLVRRVNVTACHVVDADGFDRAAAFEGEQLSLFEDMEELDARREEAQQDFDQEYRMQQAIIEARERFGKNAVLKGMDLLDGATTIARNGQIGGHRA